MDITAGRVNGGGPMTVAPPLIRRNKVLRGNLTPFFDRIDGDEDAYGIFTQ